MRGTPPIVEPSTAPPLEPKTIPACDLSLLPVPVNHDVGPTSTSCGGSILNSAAGPLHTLPRSVVNLTPNYALNQNLSLNTPASDESKTAPDCQKVCAHSEYSPSETHKTASASIRARPLQVISIHLISMLFGFRFSRIHLLVL